MELHLMQAGIRNAQKRQGELTISPIAAPNWWTLEATRGEMDGHPLEIDDRGATGTGFHANGDPKCTETPRKN